MKNSHLILIVLLAISNISFSQNLEIARILTYKKLNYEWELSSKYEYETTPSFEKATTYTKTENGWQKRKEYLRKFMPNRDTIDSSTKTWKDGILQEHKTCRCYQTNETDQISFIIEKNEGQKLLKNFDEPIKVGDLAECSKLRFRYPFETVIREADVLWRTGIPLESQEIEWEMCTPQNFYLLPDKYNRLIEMESDFSKLVFTYNSETSKELEDLLPPEYRIYPNPFFNEIFIEIPAGDVQEIEILDGFGKSIYLLEAKNQTKINIELLDLPAGFYTLNLKHSNRISTHKLIKS